MVLRVLTIIDNNTDKSVSSFSIKKALMRTDRLNFSTAINNLREICRQHRFVIEEYLETLQNSVMAESILDIYIPQEAKSKKLTPYDTALTFNPNKTSKIQEKITPKTPKVIPSRTQDIIDNRYSRTTTRRRSRIFGN